MPQRILVLDDEERYAHLLQSMLEQHFFLCESVHHPEDALEALERTSYSLVIADYKMPVMDGSEFLERARAINPDLPVFIVSGMMNTPELLKAANIGVTQVFDKPIETDNFIRSIKRFVQPLTAEEFFKRGSREPESEEDDAIKVLRSYAGKLRQLTDYAPMAQLFVQGLWDASRELSHIFVKIPPGGDVELVLRELSGWLFPRFETVYFIQAHRFDSERFPKVLERIMRDETHSRCIGVLGYQFATVEQQSAMIDCLADAPEELVFCHFIDGHALQFSTGKIDPEIIELTRENLCVLPPLKDRLADMAAYVLRYLPRIAAKEGKPGCKTLDPDAISLILSHNWPGNFAELLDVLRRAVLLSEDAPVTASMLAEAIRRRGQQPPDAKALQKLEPWLVDCQKVLIEAHLPDFGHDLHELLQAAGIPPGIIQGGEDIGSLPLLFPEVLAEPSE